MLTADHQLRLLIQVTANRWRSTSNWLTSSQRQSRVTTDGQFSSQSWCQASSGVQAQIFVSVRLWDVLSYEKGLSLLKGLWNLAAILLFVF
jgi:hypothetical protein